jgi:hypothetical protein
VGVHLPTAAEKTAAKHGGGVIRLSANEEHMFVTQKAVAENA